MKCHACGDPDAEYYGASGWLCALHWFPLFVSGLLPLRGRR